MNERITHLEIAVANLQKLVQTNNKLMLNTAEASLLTGISISYLRKLVMRKQVPFYKRGGMVLFDREELNQWLHENKVK